MSDKYFYFIKFREHKGIRITKENLVYIKI